MIPSSGTNKLLNTFNIHLLSGEKRPLNVSALKEVEIINVKIVSKEILLFLFKLDFVDIEE